MIRWGFLGAGNIASKALAPAIHAAEGAVLFAAAARDPSRAEALGAARVHPTYDALLADPDVDAVYISLANDAHLPWALAALQAGKHVLCEKPLAMSAAEVRALSSAATASGCTLVEALWYRWHPRIRLTQRLLADGRVGDVQSVTAIFGFAGVSPGNYRLDPSLGGGALYDVGCYCISSALWAFAGHQVRDVSATCDLGPTGVDLRTSVAMSFQGGGTAEIDCAVGKDLGQRLLIRGSAGQLELPSDPFTAWREQETQVVITDEGGSERIEVPAANAYRMMVEEMSSVLAGGPGWLMPMSASLACAEVIDAARGSGVGDSSG